MGLKKILNSLALASLLLASHAQAQTTEAEWRVRNTKKLANVPSYQGQANPFPLREAPPVVVVEEKPPEISIEESRQMQKAEVLARARAMMETGQAFRPNVGNVVFDGYLSGANAQKVLYKKKWFKLGDVLEVPVQGADTAIATIQELEELDPELATQVKNELESRLAEGSRAKLKIHKIEEDKVFLSDGNRTYETAIRRGGL